MNLKRLFAGFGTIALVLLMVESAMAQVDLGNYTMQGSVQAGAIPQPVPYDEAPARYQEYRDLAQQFIVPHLQALLGDKEDKYYARFDAVNVAQKNQMYSLRFGKYGLLDVRVKYFEIPHFFSDHVASTPYDENGGDFTLSTKPTSEKDLGPWLTDNKKYFDMSLLEGIADIDVRVTPTPSWTFSADLDYQNPTGQQPFGGSFMFGPNPGTYKVNELWVPTQYYIYNFGTGAEYAKDGWVVGFKYQGSFFVDDYSTLTWDNPATWANPIGPSGACVSSSVFTSAGGTGPCRGRAAMYPDNQAHNFIVNGNGQLPFNTQVMGSLEYGFWLQDSPFIPLTSNSALSQSLRSVGAPNSLGGDVRPFFTNLTIDSNPIEQLDIKATYEYFDYDNQTPAITFTGVKSLNDVADLQTPFTAYPFSFSQQNVIFEPTYRLTNTIATHFLFNWQRNHNGGLEVLQQDQTSFGPAIDWNPYQWMTFQANYQYAHRDSPGYNNNRASLLGVLGAVPPQIEELQALRRFDEATLDVNQTTLYAAVQPVENLTMFAAFYYDDYNYPNSDFGLQHTSNYTPAVGVSWDPLPHVHFFSDYSGQAYDWNSQSLDETRIPAPKPPPGKTNVWTATGRNQANDVEVGMDVAIPANRILPNPSHLKVQYTYTVGNSSVHQAGDTASATPAVDYPDVGNRQDELIVQYEYELRKNFLVDIGYYFNNFGEYDFMVDQMQNFMPAASPNSTFLGNTVWAPYTVNIGYITFRYTF